MYTRHKCTYRDFCRTSDTIAASIGAEAVAVNKAVVVNETVTSQSQ